jgi:hypothetical protein
MNAHPEPDQDPSAPRNRPARPRSGRRSGAEPSYGSLTSSAPPDEVARNLVISARPDLIAAGIHARLDNREPGAHRVVLKRTDATDVHVLNRAQQVLVLWFADHPRAAAAYVGEGRARHDHACGLAALAAQRADREIADARGARIPVDTAAGAALLAARLTDGIPLGSFGTEVVADRPERPIPAQAPALGSNPRILAAAAEQLIDLHRERRLLAAGLAPAAGINQQIHRQPTLAAWLRFGRALTLDAIDHRALTRTTELLLAAADGALKGRLSARWNAIIHPAPSPVDAVVVRRVASSGAPWDPELEGIAPPRPIAPLVDQVIGGIAASAARRPVRALGQRFTTPPPAVGGDDASANAASPRRP